MKPGDTVICIKSHSERVVTEGQEYKLHSLNIGCCQPVVDVGIKSQREYAGCGICGKLRPNNGIAWIAKKLFARPEDWNQAETMVNELTETINQPVEI